MVKKIPVPGGLWAWRARELLCVGLLLPCGLILKVCPSEVAVGCRQHVVHDRRLRSRVRRKDSFALAKECGEKGLIPVGGYDVVDLCNILLSDAFLPQTCV